MKKGLLIIAFLWGVIAYGQFKLRIPVDSANYIALIEASGTQLTDWKKLDEVQVNFKKDYHLAKKNGRWGITDDYLNFLIEPSFSRVESYLDFMLCSRYGYLAIYDQELKLVKEINGFKSWESVADGQEVFWRAFGGINFLIIKTNEGCFVLNGETLEPLSESKYDDVFAMDGTVYLLKDEKFGFVANDGTVFEPQWNSISQYNSEVMEMTNETGHRVYIGTNGTPIPDTDSTLIYYEYSHHYKVYKNGKADLFDLHDSERKIAYSGIDIFPIGRAYRDQDRNMNWENNYLYAFKREGKIGLINEFDKVIIQPKFQFLKGGNKKVLIAMLDDRYGLFTYDGTPVLDTSYTYVEKSGNRKHDEKYFRLYQEKKKGIVTDEGVIIVPLQFDEVSVEQSGIITKRNNLYGFYTFEGKEVLKPKYKKVVSNHGGLEFVGNNGRCMVGEKGLLTPLNCDKISRTQNELKYYIANKIVVCGIKDEVVVDTTVYPRPKSVRIKNSRRELALVLSDNDFAEIEWQLTGKIGSISKQGKGFGVDPVFNNVISNRGILAGKFEADDYYLLDRALIVGKEHLQSFYPSSAHVGDTLFSYQSTWSRYGWHSDDYDPVITYPNNTYEFYSRNSYWSDSANFILPRIGASSKALLRGKIGFGEGQEVMGFKEYYEYLNSYYKLKIESPGFFNLLSESPILSVQNPLWQVKVFEDSHIPTYDESFVVYEEIGSNCALVSKDGRLYGIIEDGKHDLVPMKCSEIKKVEIGSSIYFLVLTQEEALGGFSKQGWTIYDAKGRIFDDLYDEVDVVGLNLFKLTKGDTYLVVDRSGKEIYRSRPGFILEENSN